MARIIRSARLAAEPVLISHGDLKDEALEPSVATAVQMDDLAPSDTPQQKYRADLAADANRVQEQARRLEEHAQQLRGQEEELRRQTEFLRREAEERGYREGHEAGKSEGSGQWTAALEQFSALCSSTHAALEQQVEGLEDVIVEIAFSAVCKVIGEIAGTEAGVRNVVRQAMHSVVSREGVVVRISPADYAMLQSVTPEKPLIEGANFDVATDDRVTVGGCLIETRGGTLDARLETQLRQLVDTLVRAKAAQGDE